ncbi:MAG: T9SS type A sorting domain-containing protein [Calditrichia bacterium]
MFTIKNPGDQTLTFQITDANIAETKQGDKGTTQVTITPHLLSALLHKLKKSVEKIQNRRDYNVPVTTAIANNSREIVITDPAGDTNLPGMDIISVDFSEDFFNYTITINFSATPDSNSLCILSVDLDQNFGSGAYPPPFGFGLGNSDVGSEYEAFFDFSNFLGDTLGLPPSLYIFNTQDSIPTPAGLPMPIQINGNSASVSLLKFLYPFFDDNMNLSAYMLPLAFQAIPDAAPDFGHGLRGTELGSSWVTEIDSNGVASYPFSGSLAPGDSVHISIKVAAAYPMGSYSAKLIIDNNSPITPLEVPVNMTIGLPGQPVVSVFPMSISDTLTVNSGVQTANLEIANNGTGILLFSVVDSILNGEEWLEIPLPFGSAFPGEKFGGYFKNLTVEITIDPSTLLPGSLYQALLKVFSNDPNIPEISVPVEIYIESPNSIAETDAVPTTLRLHANYPNPFNPGTTISFELPQPSLTTLEIFNILGQKVVTLVDQKISAGSHSYYWNGRSAEGEPLSSGVFIYRLKAGEKTLVRKMLLVK